MRKLMWFSIGFAAACALAAYENLGKWLLFLALVCLLGAAVTAAFGKGKRAVAALLGAGLAACWFFAFGLLILGTPRQYDGQELYITITASDYTWETDYGVSGDGEAELNGHRYQVRFYLDSGMELRPGDRVEGAFSLRYTPGGLQKATHHRSNGVFLIAYPEDDMTVTRAESIPLRHCPAVLRNEILQIMTRVFPADTLAFAKGLLLGDTSSLTYAQDMDFKTAGIRHVVAVSGLHVSILFSLVYVLTGKRRGLSVLVGIPVLVLFAAMAGFTPSVNRACIMQGLMLLAMVIQKEYDPPTALGAAVLVMLAVNPMAVTSVSLQLSAGCTVGILLFSGRIREYLLDEKRLGRACGKGVKTALIKWFAGSVSVTLGAMSLTMPLCAVYFGSISLIGVVTNLLTLWLITYIFYGIMAACALGAVLPAAGAGVAWLAAWGIRAVQWLCSWLSRVPLAAIYTCSIYVTLWVIFFYVLFALFLRSKKKPVAAFILCAVLSLFVALGVSWLEPRLDDYRVSVLDVGRGQCILIQSQGENFLIDCGGDDEMAVADTVTRILLSQGIGQLDGVILTHYDHDHAGAVPYLLTRIPVEKFYLPDIADDTDTRTTLAGSAPVCWITEQRQITVGNTLLRLFPGEESKDENESSLCILFQGENCDILITGDRSMAGEWKLLQQVQLPKLEVLVAGHHGAATSTSKQLLRATQPQLAVISVGENSYGHPSAQVLERLKEQGCRIWRTDQQGTLIIRG